ncbi:MAG: DMT family transporter, partial [Bacillota bacterium]|nr:DMT family transporter [Bacillota bacterium]
IMEKIFCLLFAIVGGIAAAVQSPVNSGLGKRIGTMEAGFVSFLVGTIVLAVLVFVFGKGSLSGIIHAPKWQLIGGVLGVVAVLSVIVATPKLGVGITLVAIILGQVAMGLVIDHFGLLQTPPVPLSPSRIIGVLLIAAGVVLVFKSKI